MKKLVNLLPFLLLTILVGLSFVNSSIAISISVAALAALSGFKFYLESKEVPDYEKVFAERLEEINKSNKEAIAKLESEISRIKFKDFSNRANSNSGENVTKLTGW